MNKENSKKSHANNSNSRVSVRHTIKNERNERPQSITRKSLHLPQVTNNTLSQNQRKSVSPNPNLKKEDPSTKSKIISYLKN